MAKKDKKKDKKKEEEKKKKKALKKKEKAKKEKKKEKKKDKKKTGKVKSGKEIKVEKDPVVEVKAEVVKEPEAAPLVKRKPPVRKPAAKRVVRKSAVKPTTKKSVAKPNTPAKSKPAVKTKPVVRKVNTPEKKTGSLALTSREAVAKIRAYKTANAITNFVKGETRVTVIKAAEIKKKLLASK